MQAELGVRPVAVAGEYGSLNSAELAGGDTCNWTCVCCVCLHRPQQAKMKT